MQLVFHILANWNAAGFQVEGKVGDRRLPYVKLVVNVRMQVLNKEFRKNVYFCSLSFAKTTFQCLFGLKNTAFFSIRKA